MIKKPDLDEVKKVIPEAPNLKFLDSDGYKFVYEDIVNGSDIGYQMTGNFSLAKTKPGKLMYFVVHDPVV